MEISVIIPTYNRAHIIEKSIKSVQRQTYPVSEIIVVDDASVDSTEQVVRGLDDGRIRYVRQEPNKGNAAARNLGVSCAKYDLIAFHDSDDEWREEKIEKQIAYKNAHEDCRFIYTAFVRHFSNGDQIIPDMGGDQILEGEMLPELLFINTIGAPTVLMEKEFFNNIGGFDEKLRNLVDWDLAIRASKEGRIGFVSEILVDVEYSPNSVTNDRSEYYRSRCYMLRKYRDDYLATDTFNKTVESILTMAYEDGMLESVKGMLLRAISS